MRLTAAWAEIASKNATLKAAVVCLAASTVALSLTAARLALRTPLIIERGRSECGIRTDADRAVSAATKRDHSADEIAAFVKEALAERFNSGADLVPGFLSDEELALRQSEQHELSARAMTQTIIVRVVKPSPDGTSVAVEADRLVSVGPVRSAFVFSLSLSLGSTDRTTWNPYGLILLKASAQNAGASP